MSEKSILLGLDGSAQSRYAAELAWAMAKAGNMRVDAQHVIDSLAAWDFLNFDIAGFIGSGPYFEAHETMRTCLQELGQNLVTAYKSIAEQNGVVSEAYLDEGTTIREISARAKKCDLIVLGQRGTGMGSPEEDKRKLPRRSVAESLTHYCPKPLLVVQDRCRLWPRMRIVLGQTAVPTSLISGAVDFAQKLKMEPSVRYLYKTGTQPTDKTAPDGLRVAEDLGKSIPSLKEGKIDIRSADDIADYFKADAEEDEQTLLVIPVIEQNGVRVTPFGWAPDVVVRYLNHAAVLFWLEGQGNSAKEAAESATTTV